MTTAPALQDGEEVIHHHIPDLGAFKRTALLMLVITLAPTSLMVALLPDTFWPAVPLFVTCLLLMQERYNLGRYAAWITNKRILFQGDEALELSDIGMVGIAGNAVRLRPSKGGPATKLYYPKDRNALAVIIETARQDNS